MAARKLPLIVVALAVPVVAGFLVGGPALGTALGALVAVVLVIVAVRQRPLGPIGRPADDRRRVLLVVTHPLEEPAEVREVVRAAHLRRSDEDLEVQVLAPARIGFLDRWASDVEGAREAAQRSLVVTCAELAKAGIPAEGRVGDESLVQAVEDQLGSFPANEVVLVDGGENGDGAAELRSRLVAEFRHVTPRHN